jgi:hypothetical protein
MSEVLSELEAIGAVGEKVVLLRLEAPPRAEVRLAPPPPPEVPSVSSDLTERVRLLHEVSAESLRKLEIIAKEVQDLRQVFSRVVEATLLEPEGERDAEVHPEA